MSTPNSASRWSYRPRTCPRGCGSTRSRDGLQNEKATVPTEVKAEFVRRLADSGLTTIEATSFVHPKWVPQLADAEQLFPLVSDLGRSSGVHLPVLVPNERGLDRALALGARHVALFASATESFAKANLNRTVDESLAMSSRWCPGPRRTRYTSAATSRCVSVTPGRGPSHPPGGTRLQGPDGHGLRRAEPRRHDRRGDTGSCADPPRRAERGGPCRPARSACTSTTPTARRSPTPWPPSSTASAPSTPPRTSAAAPTPSPPPATSPPKTSYGCSRASASTPVSTSPASPPPACGWPSDWADPARPARSKPSPTKE